MIITEVCANSLSSALNAEKGGASRIELCTNLESGGLTPSAGTILLTKEQLNIPVFVLIRPRTGDFVYNETEFEIMKKNIQFCKAHGVDGVVVGCLTSDGDLDLEKNKKLLQLAKPMGATFHRAFDDCNDPFLALKQIIEMGFDRILTSGQAHSAAEGQQLIKKLVEQANRKISIMPGAGVNAQNIKRLVELTLVKEIHFSAKEKLPGGYLETSLSMVQDCVAALKV